MVFPVKTDFISFLANLVSCLQPFARANFVSLHFESNIDKIEITYHPETVLPDLTQLLCRIITFTPQGYEVTLSVMVQDSFIHLQVVNSGSELNQIPGIVGGLKLQVKAQARNITGTQFNLTIPVDEETTEVQHPDTFSFFGQKEYIIPPFFKKLKGSLHTHFSNIQNLEKAANARSEQDGIFLKKVNAVIIAHLSLEHFDMNTLSRSMAMSRSQLYRRLIPLTRLSPANYIKFVRLQKAKELLNETDATIGEIAFQTGFMNASHFTRAFRVQFGLNPSDLRRNQKINTS
jgi:AraC-like DNA-binding protein